MATVVPTQSTPISKEQAFSALVRTWGPDLTRQLARGLLSLIWIETARGGSVKNFNPGNISANPKTYPGLVWLPPWVAEPTDETSPRNVSLHAAMLKGQAPSAFRAYNSLDEGFIDFVRQIKRSFPEVIAGAQTGSPDDFRVALSQKYSHDYRNVAATKTFESFFKLFDPIVSSLPSAPEVAPPLPLAPGLESESSEPSEPFSGSCQLPEAGFLRGQEFSVPGVQDEPEKKV